MPDCDNKLITTYQYFHKGFPGNAAVKAPKIKQCDPELISGNFTNNIRYRNVPPRSKTWPKRFNAEDYQHFLNRLECCKKELFKLYYRDPDVDFSLLDRTINELEKTVYQVSYSPNEYKLIKRCRFSKETGGPANMIYYPTTYGTYHNRIAEIERFKDALVATMCKKDTVKLRNELSKIYKLGRTTYNDTICMPAMISAKTKILRNAPIDRYTLRKV